MKRIAFFFSLLLLAASCKHAPTLKDKDYEKFAAKLDTTLSDGDPSVLRDALNMDNITEKGLAVFPGGFFDKSQFKTGVKQGLLSTLPKLAEQLQDGEYTLLRTFVKDGKHHALYRLYAKNGGMNYHDYELDEKDGKVVINDLYVYATGQTLSESLANIVATTLHGNSSSSGAKTQTDLLAAARDYLAQGEDQKALEACEQMSDDWKKTKIWQVLHLTAAVGLDADAREQAMRDYQKAFPKDPPLSLLMISPYYERQEYDKAMDCVNQLDKDVNDPALNVMRGNLYSAEEKYDDATRCFWLVLDKVDGEMKEVAWQSIIAISITRAEEPKDILPVCRELVDKKHATKDDISTLLEDYEGVKTDPDVKAWLGS